MTRMSDITDTHELIRSYFPAEATVSTAREFVVGRVDVRAEVTSVEVIPEATVTGAASNYFSFQLRNRGAADAGTTDIAVVDFAAASNVPARVPKAFVMGAAAGRLVNAGDVLTLERVITGSGLAGPAGVVVVRGSLPVIQVAAVPFASGKLAGPGAALAGWSLRETAGAVGTVRFYDNATAASGPLLAVVAMPANTDSSAGGLGVRANNGIWASVVAGTVEGCIYIG